MTQRIDEPIEPQVDEPGPASEAESGPPPSEGSSWCRVCGTTHRLGRRCPGEVLATDAERHGWRVQVEEGGHLRVYATLIAPAGDLWRARIVTCPNVIWVVPGGVSIKFLGRTPADAEQQAIDYIKAHCRNRGCKVRKELPSVESGKIDPEQDAAAATSETVLQSKRELRPVPIRYGIGGLHEDAYTEDLSEGGLFVRTDSPLPVGTDVRLQVEVGGFKVPLRGVVQWNREVPEEGRPVGMGVKLFRPHARYVDYVRSEHGEKEEGEA